MWTQLLGGGQGFNPLQVHSFIGDDKPGEIQQQDQATWTGALSGMDLKTDEWLHLNALDFV